MRFLFGLYGMNSNMISTLLRFSLITQEMFILIAFISIKYLSQKLIILQVLNTWRGNCVYKLIQAAKKNRHPDMNPEISEKIAMSKEIEEVYGLA